MAITVLVTGFSPFGGVAHNPSQAVLALLPDHVAGARVVTAVLPVDAQSVPSVLQGLYLLDPKVVIHTGVAIEREVITIERTAQNRLDFPQPDNAGRQLKDQQVVEGAPPQLSSRLPVDRIVTRWKEAGLPTAASDDAGAFLCNQTMYLALYTLPETSAVGFVHLPPDETLGPAIGKKHLLLADMKRALVLAIETAVAQVESERPRLAQA